MPQASLRDNSIGIPADLRDKLFQPFFTTKPTGEGTGQPISWRSPFSPHGAAAAAHHDGHFEYAPPGAQMLPDGVLGLLGDTFGQRSFLPWWRTRSSPAKYQIGSSRQQTRIRCEFAVVARRTA